jgi:hypothetical protein
VKRNPFVFVLLLSFFLLAAGFFSYSFLLPRYIENSVLPGLGDRFFTPVSGEVYSIGFHGTDLGDIVMGDPRNAAVRIGSVHAVYSPGSLLAKKLETITFNGVTLNLILQGNKILLPGIDLESLAGTGTEEKAESQQSAINLPIELESLLILNGLVNIHSENRLIPVSFTLKITRQENSGSADLPVYFLEMQLSPPGLQISITGTMDLAGNTVNVAAAADFFDLTCLGFLLGEMQKIPQFGPGSLSGTAKFRIAPFQLDSAEIEAEIESLHWPNGPFTIASSSVETGKSVPLNLKIKAWGKHINVAAQGAITEPISGVFSLNGSLVNGEDSFSGTGKFLLQTIDTPSLTQNENLRYLVIKGNPELAGNFALEMGSSGTWQAKLESNTRNKKGSKPESFQVKLGTNVFETNTLSAALHGKCDAGYQEITVAVTLSEFHALLDNTMQIKTPQAKLDVSANQKSGAGQETITSGSFALSLSDTQFIKNGLTGKGGIILEGTIPPQVIEKMGSIRAAGNLSANNTVLEDQPSGLKIFPLDIQIPWHWPLSGQEMPGSITAAHIAWKNNELGSFEAEIGLQGAEYSIVGRQTSSLAKGVETSVSGTAVIADSGVQANLSVHIPPTSFTSLHLGMIDPALKNSYLAGELGLDGAFRYDANGLQGDLSVSLQNGRYEYPQKKYAVDGISVSLQMPFLPELRSASAQNIFFDKGTIGNLVFEDGSIIWHLESADTLFIEESVVRWSGGRIFTNAVRISPGRKDFVISLFCDRLILAEILRQFGITNAEGEGTVSGRVPLIIRNGQGGSVKVAALDLLSAGIPKNTPRFAQVDFAAEALKNFKYNWVKLLLNSAGEDLVMQMHMDGKPMRSLPFTYDTQTGIMQRVDDITKGIDQPIRLDVNFRLPLNRLLGYSGKIQDILEKIK